MNNTHEETYDQKENKKCRCFRQYSSELNEMHNIAYRTFYGINCTKNIFLAMELYIDAMLKGNRDSENNFFLFLRECYRDLNIKEGYGWHSVDRKVFLNVLPEFLINKSEKILKLDKYAFELIFLSMYLDNIKLFYDLFIFDDKIFNIYNVRLKNTKVYELLKYDIVNDKIKNISDEKKQFLLMWINV